MYATPHYSDSSEPEKVLPAHNNDDLPHFTISVQGRPFQFLADSGATVNLLSKKDFGLLKPTPTPQQSSKKISA